MGVPGTWYYAIPMVLCSLNTSCSIPWYTCTYSYMYVSDNMAYQDTNGSTSHGIENTTTWYSGCIQYTCVLATMVAGLYGHTIPMVPIVLPNGTECMVHVYRVSIPYVYYVPWYTCTNITLSQKQLEIQAHVYHTWTTIWYERIRAKLRSTCWYMEGGVSQATKAEFRCCRRTHKSTKVLFIT
jgi:hypothetical protein